MAVPEQTPYIEHTGNGVTTSFSLGFQCESKDHLIVLVDEIEPPIATWSLTGGNVIFTTAPAAGKKIKLQRNTSFGRTTNYQSFNNSFRPQTVNIDFDRIWWKLQELGVADWLMKLYVDRLHQQQEQEINDLKDYVDDRDDELRAYLMEEIRKQGVALDQLDDYYNYLMQRLAQIAVDKGWDASFVVDGNENQHEINNTAVRIKKSVAEMININNPKDGQTVRTLSYHAGLSKGGNTYRYEPSRQLENDGGSVINGWVVQDKTALTVWDFGYKDGDTTVSRAALSNALTSDFPLELLAETLDAHVGAPLSYIHWQTISQNKLIFGKGRGVSVIKGLRLQSQSDVFIAKDFSIDENGLNYALFPLQYNFLLIDNFSSKGNLDAVLVMGAKSAQSKALIRNCYSENSSRIGFTSDVAAKNVTFENCRSFNCRQGFHAEAEADTTFIDCVADACGNNAMPPIPDYQPPEYAGGFRLHKYTRARLIRCKNINKNGTNIDQLGGGGTDLYIEQCEGIDFFADFGATETYRDIEVKGLKQGGLVLTAFSPKVAGKIIVHDFDGGSLELISNTVDTVNVVTYAEFVNVKAARLQIASQANDATIHMDNVFVRSTYFNEIRGFTHHVLGDLVYSWINSGETHYPNLGFRFNSAKAKTFTLQSFRTIGAGGGWHLSFENFPVNCKPVVTNAIDLGSSYNILSNVAFLHLAESQTRAAQAASAELGQASYYLNNQYKFLGRDVYNTTISKFMKATGSSATSTWVSYDGATTITPV